MAQIGLQQAPEAPTDVGLLRLEGIALTHILGQGADSVVYAGQLGDAPVAVKVWRQHAEPLEEEAAQARFHQEVATLLRFHHPNLLELLATGQHSGQRYLVTRRIDGPVLSDRIPVGGLTEAEALQVGRDLTRALVELHRQGFVHRDVKARNVLWAREGCVLIDLGLATRPLAQSGDPQPFAGTLAYAAPEQVGVAAGAPDARSDLYSLGVLLYLCATGRLPFESEDTAQLVQLHLHTRPVPPRELNPSLGAGFSQLIEALLEKEPKRRPASSAETLARLDALRGEPAAASPPPFLPGREAAWKTVGQRLTPLTRGEGSLVRVSGESGSGKSMFLAQLASQAALARLPVLATRCSREDLPLAVFQRLFEEWFDFLATLPPARIQELEGVLRVAIGPYGLAFRLLSPRFGALLGAVQAAERTADDEARMVVAIGEVLATLARACGGLVLSLDDAQDLESSSTKLVRHLLRELSAQPLLIALAATEDRALLAISEGVGASQVEDVRLAPLEESQVTEVIRTWLGGREGSDELRRQTLSAAGGNLRAVNDFLQFVLAAGIVTVGSRRCEVDEEALRRLPRPATFSQQLQRQIEELSQPLRLFLQLCAVEGDSFDPQVVQRAFETAGGRADRILQQAVSRQFVDDRGRGQALFAAARFRELLLQTLTPPERRARHADLARAWEGQGGGPQATALGRARHFREMEVADRGVAERALAALTLASQQLLELFVNAQAHDYLLRIQDLAQRWSLPLPTEFHNRLGQARERLGMQDEAQAAYSATLRTDPSPVHRAHAHARLAQLHLNGRRTNAAMEEVQKGLTELRHPLPRLKPVLVLTALFRVFAAYFFLRRPHLRRSTPQAVALGRSLVELYTLLGVLSYFHGNRLNIAFAFILRFYEGARLGPGPELARGYGAFGTFLGYAGNAARAQRTWKEAMQIARDLPDRPALAHVHHWMCLGMHVTGKDALAAERQGRIFAAEHMRWAVPEDSMLVHVDLTWNLLMRGHLQEAEAVNQRAIALSEVARSEGKDVRQIGGHYLSYAFAIATALGHESLAMERHQQASAAFESGAPDGSRAAFYLLCDLFRARELGRGTERVMEIYALYRKLCVPLPQSPLYNRGLPVLRGYVELTRALESGDPAALRETLTQLRPLCQHPTLGCHLKLLEAGARVAAGEPGVEDDLLGVEQAARANDNPWVLFELHALRARLYQNQQNPRAMELEASLALSLASTQGWEVRARRISAEFDVHLRRGKSSTTPRPGSEESASSSDWKRQLEVLHEVALATSETIDAEEHARRTLDEIIRLLGAERAFLLMVDPATGAMRPRAGRGLERQNLPALAGFSRTVIDRVVATQAPVVVTGSEQGEVSTSRSAVVQGLLSIIAVPMMVRGTLEGVVYLDTRVARSVFTPEDVRILTAVSSQIAIAAKTAQFAQVEAERRALEKDMALTVAMQNLLLPRAMDLTAPGYRLASLFQPAARTGGDWVWFERLPDDCLMLLLGDVTGHGAGAAMVTAAMAGCYQAIRQSEPTAIPALMEKINDTVFALCRGAYMVTLCVLHLDPRDGRTRVWNAAGPPAVKLGTEGEITLLTAPGDVLGAETRPALGFVDFRLTAGERLLLTTDGLLEYQNAQGRHPFAAKRLGAQLKASRQESAATVRDQLRDRLLEVRQEAPQEDDVTFVVLDAI